MSQIYKTVASTPSVATSYHTDDGDAVPAANILNILGQTGSGITTSGAGNTVTINFVASDVVGNVTTVGAQTLTLLSVPLGSSAGVYTVDIKIVAFCTAGPDANNGNGYTVTGAVLTSGVTATKLGTEAIDEFEGIVAIVRPVFTTSGNNAIITITGLAGDTINWRAEAEYIFRGAV